MKKLLSLLIFVIFFSCNNSEEKFTIKSRQTKNGSIYQIVDEKGNLIKELDTAKYIICFSEDQLGYFAVFAMKDKKGWIAIDKNEKELFEVYNTSFGEPSPDEITDGKIRIIDKNEKIGFANYKGQIIINPQFEMASSFNNGKAIIGESCEKIPWDLPNDLNHSDCHHYSIKCEKQGYIDNTGKIILLGNYTFEEITKKIKRESPSK